MTTCRCGSIPLSLDVRRPGPNRGRWYFKCPTGTCSFFQWDESPHPFIRHPTEAYAAAQPLSGVTGYRTFSHFRHKDKSAQTSLTKKTVKVSFSVLNSDLIGIKSDSNLTLDLVIKNIKDIQWSDEYNQWTIPATVGSYNVAIGSFATELPNLQVELDQLPETILDGIIEATLIKLNNKSIDSSGRMTNVEAKWTEFVESDFYSSLKPPILQKAVMAGIERDGRILIGNENGIGTTESALALTRVYQNEWPVLFMTPSIMSLNWKMEAMKMLGLNEDQIVIVDPKTPRAELFQQRYIVRKRTNGSSVESTPKPPKRRRTYKQKMQQRLKGNYQSSDSESEEEEQIHHELHYEDVKVYIIDYDYAAKRKKEITKKEFKVIVCTDSHFLRSWTKGESKTISKLLQETKRSILVGTSSRITLPVNLYTQINAIAPKMYPDFEVYAKRYCGTKNTVFGLDYKSRSNEHEFTYMLDGHIWFCPRSEELKKEFPEFVREAIAVNIKKNSVVSNRVKKLITESTLPDIDTEQQMQEIEELHKKTSELKKDFVPEYLDYIRETYKRPKIAIVHYNDNVFRATKEFFKKHNVKFVTLDNSANANDICIDFNKNMSVQYILLDMKVEDLNISLDSVDLLIFMELPFDMVKLYEFETFFKSEERKGPLSIKYLNAVDTIDDYLWPLVKTL